MERIPVSDYEFNGIMRKLFDGYGKKVTDQQLQVMFSRLNHHTADALRSAARKWIDNNPRPPAVSDMAGLLGGGKVGQKTEICQDCGSQVEHVYTVGTGEHKKHVCGDCWYELAKKMNLIPEWRLR